MATYDTVANLVSEAAVELGLGAVSDVYASTDESVVTLRTLLKSVGRELLLGYAWLQTQVEHTFATTAATSYALPSGFSRMVDGSAWNRTQRLPILPVSAQQWQQLQALQSVTTTAVLFRPKDLTLSIWPTTNTGETMAFEYLSTYWVRATASAAPDKDAPTVNTDVVHLEAVLVVKALKLAFLRTRGFDTTAAQRELDMALDGARSASSNAAPVLAVTPTARELGNPVGVSTGGGLFF
jgi:hypothetical protein